MKVMAGPGCTGTAFLVLLTREFFRPIKARQYNKPEHLFFQ